MTTRVQAVISTVTVLSVFACGAYGDALDWIQQINNLSQREVIKELERRVGVGAVTHSPTKPTAKKESVKSCEVIAVPQKIS